MSAAVPRPPVAIMLAGLVLALGITQLGLPGLIAPGEGIGARVAREAIWFAIGGAVLLWVVQVERLPLASIGLRRPTAGTFGWAALATIALIASVMLSYALILPALGLEMNMGMTKRIVDVPVWLMMLTALRAGIVEEILFRGYPIERIEALTGNRWLAAIVPGGIFILAHLGSWGPGQLIVVAFGAVILTALYLWRRDLPCVMIAHAAADLIGFTLARLQS
ncbi:CPBP family intramembrane glutamic endopeptidase [Sphingomonas sp. 1P06PA]|uniref:CPBP family intramembrane glutamic endopeptidase n=1 Tax=Sphingomonas sp. 1P06PA TaxID=554121 RepID=UPI0039A54FDD